ncbi:unnamed protein product [Tuber melanosporum]|uniref:(Perigord truffle) hypothetical protein n=1 Tax=Tuber melanosporum (strain Mel28) TaxID=656061 RepID=D5G4R6_TUBMM|nr:uncharacterized protein GSTUM_00000066001 [Tuber melanosporum]CAZ79502.1 unnamed protein product [Tuber melanosporum]
MDKALDDVVRERSHDKRSSSSSNDRRSRRNPRGGVRKTGRRDNTYNDSLAWVHDKYDGDLGLATNEPLRRAAGSDMRHNSDTATLVGAGKLRVENIHYELGEEELLGLFERQGVVLKLELKYDRAGRSEGIAFVTYEREADAKRAIAEFDGANANGQPIHLTLVHHHHQNEGKSLFDRIRAPDPSAPLSTGAASSARDRARRYTDSPERDSRRDPTRRPTPPNIDRYVPPERRRERPRSSEPTVGGSSARRRGAYSGSGGGGGGREDRPYNNSRRYGNGHAPGPGRLGAGGGVGGGAGNRARKTVEELDEEMNNYFADAGAQQQQQQGQQQVGGALAQQADEDEEMIL